MPSCEISHCAQISKSIAVRHFGLGGRESLETAVSYENHVTRGDFLGNGRKHSLNFDFCYNISRNVSLRCTQGCNTSFFAASTLRCELQAELDERQRFLIGHLKQKSSLFAIRSLENQFL